jgi:hypothetical protein
MPRFQVILTDEEADRLAAYCDATGHKKSPLTARLIRDHLDQVGFSHQPDLLKSQRPLKASRKSRTRA